MRKTSQDIRRPRKDDIQAQEGRLSHEFTYIILPEAFLQEQCMQQTQCLSLKERRIKGFIVIRSGTRINFTYMTGIVSQSSTVKKRGAQLQTQYLFFYYT